MVINHQSVIWISDLLKDGLFSGTPQAIHTAIPWGGRTAWGLDLSQVQVHELRAESSLWKVGSGGSSPDPLIVCLGEPYRKHRKHRVFYWKKRPNWVISATRA